ncbi:MAG: hypothetical protein AAGC44_10930 [Planctomycetota bacterium]
MPESLLGMSYQPVLPVWVIVIAVLPPAVLSIWLALKFEGWVSPLFLRLVSVFALGWALLNPVVEVPSSGTGSDRPRLTLLVDTSASMARTDAGPGEDMGRLAYARQTWLSEPGLSELAGFAELDVRTFEEEIVGADAFERVPDGRATHLFDVVSRAAGDVVVVISDGHDTSGRGLARLASDGPTVFAVPVGASNAAPDLALQAWAESDHLFAGQPTGLTAQVYHRGLADRPVVIDLLEDGQVVDSQRMVLADTLTAVGFEVRPDLPSNQPSTVHAYTLRVALEDGNEAFTENNQQDAFVQVSRDRVRVLVLEGQPHWETRAIARALAASPRFEVSGRYALGGLRRVNLRDPDAEAGVTSDSFAGYDVVVMGRGVERLLTPVQAEELNRFVEQDGGAIVFARGRPTSSDDAGSAVLATLAPILPVDFGPERPAAARLAEAVASGGSADVLTRLGDRLNWSRLPGMLAVTEVTGRRASSVVVLEARDGAQSGSSAAGVVTMRVGRGATMAVLADGMWRWQLQGDLQGNGAEGNPVNSSQAYAAFWTRAIQWLASSGAFLPGQDVSLQLSAMTRKPGEPVEVTVSTRFVEAGSYRPRLAVTAPDGRQSILTPESGGQPGVHRYAFVPSLEGSYAFSLSTPGRGDLVPDDLPIQARLVVADRAVEFRDTAARPDVLKQLTEQTGGRCLEVDEYEPVVEALQTLAKTRATDPGFEPVFNRGPVFALIAGCMGLHWLLRRRGGLL